MKLLAAMIVAAGLLETLQGCLSWRSGRRRSVLLGATFLLSGVYLWLPEGPAWLRYALLAAWAALVLAGLVTINRDARRGARAAMLGVGATVVPVAASALLPNLPSQLEKALGILTIVLGMSSVVMVARLVVRTLRGQS